MRSCSCHGQSLWRMLCLLPWRALLSKNDLSNSATSPGVCLANPARRKKDTQGTKFSPCVSFHCFFSFIFLFWWVGVEGGCKVSSLRFQGGKKEFSSRPLWFSRELNTFNTFPYFVAGWKLPMSGPGSQSLGSAGHWCHRSTDNLRNFLKSKMERRLHEEIRDEEKMLVYFLKYFFSVHNFEKPQNERSICLFIHL